MMIIEEKRKENNLLQRMRTESGLLHFNTKFQFLSQKILKRDKALFSLNTKPITKYHSSLLIFSFSTFQYLLCVLGNVSKKNKNKHILIYESVLFLHRSDQAVSI